MSSGSPVRPDPDVVPLARSPSDVRTELLNDIGEMPSWSQTLSWARGHVTGSVRTDNQHQARFSRGYRKRKQAQLFEWDRTTRAELDTPYEALLTFTGDPVQQGEYLPVLACLDALTTSRTRRQRRLQRVLDDRRWAWIRVLGAYEGHDRQGYPHVHQLVRVEGHVQPSEFDPVLEAHIADSPVAHRREMGGDAVVVERIDEGELKRSRDYPNRQPTTARVNYIADHVLELDPRSDAPRHEALLASALLAGEASATRVRSL